MTIISQIEALAQQAIEIQGNIDKAQKEMAHACRTYLPKTALDAANAAKMAQEQSYSFWRALRTLGIDQRVRTRAYEIEKPVEANQVKQA